MYAGVLDAGLGLGLIVQWAAVGGCLDAVQLLLANQEACECAPAELQAGILARLCSQLVCAAIERVIIFYLVLHVADLAEWSVVTLYMLCANAEDRSQGACCGELEENKTALLYFVVLQDAQLAFAWF